MKLYPVRLSSLQYVEGGQFIIRLLSDFDNKPIDPTTDVEIKASYDSLKLQSPIFNSAMMQVTARAESVLLLQLDHVRDHKVSALNRGLSVHEFSDEPGEIAAYLLVKTIMNKYKNVEKMNFEAETLGIYNLCAELRDAAHLAAVTDLGLVPLVNKMEAANNDFKDVFNQRSTAVIDTTVFDAKALRKAIFETYNDFADYSLQMAKRKNTAYYIDILTVINNGRKYYADILAIRRGHAAAHTPPTPPVI